MKTTILRNIFFGVFVLVPIGRILAADISDRLVDFGNARLVAPQPAFIMFDAPGAVNGTYGQAINSSGGIVGSYFDENFVPHGFVRDRDGTITAFDAPGGVAGTEIGGNDIFAPGAMNPAGAITGTYFDESFVSHGFLRTHHGSLTMFDVSEA